MLASFDAVSGSARPIARAHTHTQRSPVCIRDVFRSSTARTCAPSDSAAYPMASTGMWGVVNSDPPTPTTPRLDGGIETARSDVAPILDHPIEWLQRRTRTRCFHVEVRGDAPVDRFADVYPGGMLHIEAPRGRPIGMLAVPYRAPRTSTRHSPDSTPSASTTTTATSGSSTTDPRGPAPSRRPPIHTGCSMRQAPAAHRRSAVAVRGWAGTRTSTPVARAATPRRPRRGATRRPTPGSSRTG